MSATLQSSRVSILVKALPQHSATHGETVCCAGVTAEGEFKRLYPVRFRHLTGEASFDRWDWVSYRFRLPTSDRRAESCHVMEDSIKIVGKMPARERAPFLDRLVSPSIEDAAGKDRSLALIRPIRPRFIYKRKSAAQIEKERRVYAAAASQGSLLDDQLKALEPTPYEFRFRFDDGSGPHDFANGDWEAHAMFFNGRRREGSDEAVLKWMDHVFNVEYPGKGMLFCVGNQQKRPQTWQLLGILRVDRTDQVALF